ncbi:hypothetical protein [Listeria seeligeri]|uniref:hypothetical protein n=1 Tax=Listeria seeligeri TaxID=1640 RepID=UPI001628FF50|nr:hypothetical protein [Listeria seeligeri]MBC1851175.1 hypothetical protein [Listeria seeligeri]MBC1929340.1 hypothetical protein [Listeria seeligeri]MBF2370272.1 hypothetical protein [Listeria seeligeri]MBF2390469.1 hypothetical protein [Listeria seeligeri]
MKQQSQEIAELIMKNPDLPVVTLTDIENGSGYSSFAAGCHGEACIDYIYNPTGNDLLLNHSEDRPYFKFFDEVDGLEILSDRVSYRDDILDVDYLKKESERIWESYAWRKVILIYSAQLDEVAYLDLKGV